MRHVVCENESCSVEFETRKEGARFCSAKCRVQWHREHSPRGVVKVVRRLSKGGASVTIHFDEPEAERALRFMPRSDVFVGEA